LEVEVDESRNPLSYRAKGSNNKGVARVIGFVDFREEIEGRGARIGDMKEREFMSGETMEGNKDLKESEKGFVVGFGIVVME